MAYASGSKAQARELKHQLCSLVQSNFESVTDYMQRAKSIFDKLASFQKPVLEEDLIDMILDGLSGPLVMYTELLVLALFRLMTC